MTATQHREHGDPGTERPKSFGLLELTSSDVEFLARNLPLAKQITDDFVEQLFDQLLANSDFGAIALKSGDLEQSKLEYKSYFLGLFGGVPFHRPTDSSEFVHRLDTRYYLTALPLAIGRFAELALVHPDRSMEHPVLAEGHMPDLVKALSIKLWADALTAVNSYSSHQEEIIASVVTESNKWQAQAALESRVMVNIAEIIQSTPAIDQAATELIGKAVKELIQFDRFSISRYDPKTNTHTIGPAVGIEPYSAGHQMKVDPEQIARDYTESDIKIFDEAGIDDLIIVSPSIEKVKAGGIKTLMGVALRWHGELLGFISIQSKHPNAYDESETAIASRLGRSISAALVAADQISTLGRQSSAGASVSHLVQALMSDSTAESGLREFTRSLVDVFDTDLAVVNIFAEFSSYPLLSAEYDRESGKFDNTVASHSIPESIIQELLQPEARLVGRSDLARVAETFAPVKRRLRAGFVRAASIGLEWQGESVGSIAVLSKDEASLNQASLELLEHIASQVSGSIGNVRQTLRLEYDFQNQLAISEMVDSISSTVSIEECFQQFSPLLQRLFGASRISIVIYQPGEYLITDRYRYSPSTGHEYESELSEVIPSRIMEGFDNNRAKWVDRETLESFADVFPAFASRFTPADRVAITVQFKWQDTAVGSFTIFGDRENAFEENQRLLLERVAAHISGAIGYSLLNRRLESDYTSQVAISELADAISTAESVDAGFEKFTRLLHELYSSARVAVSIFEPNAWVITDMYKYDAVDGHIHSGNLNINIPPQIVEAVGGHTPNRIDKRLLEKFAPIFPPYVDRLAEGTEAGITLPLWWQGDPVGSVSVFVEDEKTLGEPEMLLLARIAAHVSGAIGYLLLNRRLESEFADQVAITDLATALNYTEPPYEDFEVFSRLLRRLFSADSVAVAIYAPITRRVTDVYFFGREDGYVHETGEFPDIPPELAAELSDLATNIVDLELLKKHAPHFQPWADRLAEENKGSMIMRLRWQGAVVGSLTIFAKDEEAFGEHKAHLFERIASHVSGAIGNLLLNRGLEAGFRRQTTLARIGQIIGSAFDIDNVFQEVVPELRQLIEFDELRISTLDIESSTTTILFDSIAENRGFAAPIILPLPGTLTALTLASEKPVRVAIGPTTFTDSNSENTTLRDPSSPEIISAVGVPLVSDGITFGSAQFRSKSSTTFDSVSDELLMKIAAQLSGAIAYHRVNERLSGELREQTTLAEVSRIIGSDLDIKSTFGEVEVILHDLIPYTSMYAATVDIESQSATNFYHSINEKLGANIHRSSPLDRTIMAVAVESQKPTRIPLDEHGFWAGGGPLTFSIAQSERSVIAIPLISEGKVLGIVEFHSDKENAYENIADELFEQIGAHLSGAIAYHQVNQQLSQELREQSVLSRVGQIIGSGLNIDAVLDETLNTIRELIEFDSFFVNSINADGTHFTNLYVNEVVASKARSGRLRPMEGSLTKATITAGNPLRATIDASSNWEIDHRPPEEIERDHLIDVISIPLVSDGKIFGVVQFRAVAKPGNFNRINDEFLVRLAAQLAGAISYDIVNERLEKEANEQATLARISQIVGSELDVTTAFDEVAEILQGLIQFNSMYANTVDIEADSKTYAYVNVKGITSARVGRVTRLEGSVSDAVQRARKPVRIELTEDGSWTAGSTLLNSASRDEKSIVGVPLISEGKIFGTLQFRSGEPNAYTELTDEFLERVAAHLAGAIAYSQVNERLEKEATEQATLARISRILGSELDIKTAFDEVADSIRDLIPFNRLFVTTVDQELCTKTDIYASNFPDAPRPSVGVAFPLNGSLTAAVIEKQSPIRAELDEAGNWSGDIPLKNAARRDERTILGVPLISAGRVFGTLQFRSKDQHAYISISNEFLERFASHIAGAIAFNQVNEQLEKEATEQATLARIGQIVGSELDVESVFDQVASTLAELIKFEVAMVTAPNDTGTMLRNQPVFGPLADAYASTGWYSIESTLAGITLETKKPIREKIQKEELSESQDSYELSNQQGLISALAIPLISEGSAFAVLQFRSTQENAYDDLSDEILERIAEQIAGAIAYDMVNARLQSELDEQTVITRISQILGASSDLSVDFSELADELKTIIDFDTILVHAFDPEAGVHMVRYSSGLITEHTKIGTSSKIKKSLSEMIINERRPVRSVTHADYADEHSVVIEEMLDGSNTAIAIPLIAQGEVQGALQLRTFEHNAYPRSQDRFLTLIAEQISGAMARAELSESQLILALERERAEGLESQNQQLVQLQRTREQFLGMITHELRTPLTSISAFTDILGHNKEETLTERQFQQLGAVSRNATQLSELIDDLIHMSRMERGQFELTLDRADLVELVKQVCESMEPVIQHRSQQLVANLEISNLRLDLDHSRMTQVLNNLISNASKFSPQGSTVTVALQLLDDDVQIEVSDEGPGIDLDKIEAVFDPFYRIESDRVRKVPGTGLGLHVARTIVRQHGGDISVVNNKTAGSTLRIVLPLARNE